MLILLVCLLSAVDSLTALDADDVKLSKAQQQFSTELFQTIAANSSYAKDVFFSPFSVYSAMLTVYVASAGSTEKLMEHFLRFDSSSKPEKNYITKRFLNEASTNESKEYELVSVDRIYFTPDIKVKPDKEKQFGEKVAVFKTNKRADEINNWISKYTKGMIQNLVEKGSIKSTSTIVFVNAAYFKGYWTVPLTDGTNTSVFTNSDGTLIKTLFMSANDGFFKSMTDQDLKAQIISLPYEGDDLSMIIILPTTKPQKNASPPLADVVKKLTVAKFQKIVSALQAQKDCTTDLMIPKFESEENYELKKIFEQLGDKELFTQPMDLTNLFESRNLTLDRIVHKAKVNVYENGTEAAAGTAAVVENSAEPICPTTFHADHPFIYIIYDKANSFIQYMGILNTPKPEPVHLYK